MRALSASLLIKQSVAQPPKRGSMRWKDLGNAAGAITIGRLGIAVTFPFFIHRPDWAIIAYTIAIISDVVDGNLARWTDTQSHTGAVVDGWVDKILHINAAWAMTLHGYIPGWWMWLWFSRELIQGAMVFWLTGPFYRGEVRVQHTSLWGRATAVSLAACIIVSFLGQLQWALPLTWFTGVAGLISGIRYFARALEDRSRLR